MNKSIRCLRWILRSALPVVVLAVTVLLLVSPDMRAEIRPPFMAAMDFDLALRKTTAKTNVAPGDTLVFDITIFNQGNQPVMDIVVMDRLPDGTALFDDWVPGSNTATRTIAGPLQPGDSITLQIHLFILPDAMGDLINEAEIIAASDVFGNQVSDFDSTYDTISGNDNVVDDEILDNGAIDEDDHDTEGFTVSNCDIDITGVTPTDPANCGFSNGAISIAAAGDRPLEFSLDGGQTYQDGPFFTGLPAGIYGIAVRYRDTDDCATDGGTVTLSDPNQPVISTINSTDLTNCGTVDGAIEIIATGTNLEYTITGGLFWDSGNTFMNLAAGTYSVGIRHTGGICESPFQTVELTAPDAIPVTDVSQTDPTMCMATDGTVTVTATGTDLRYSIDGGATFEDNNGQFTGLSAGTYEVRVRTLDGSCTVIAGVVDLAGGPIPVFNTGFSQNASSCEGSDGIITVSLSNDDGDFRYSIDGGLSFQDAPTFSGLMAGDYQLSVQRRDGSCQTDGPIVTLDDPPTIVIDDVAVTDNANCVSPDGTITITASGGSGNGFLYSIDGGDTYVFNNSFGNLPGGTYVLRVQESNFGCNVSAGTITIGEPVAPVITDVSFTDPTGCTNADGSITVTSTGGMAPVEYRLNDGAWTTNNVFNGLNSGSYVVEARNADGTCAVAADPVELSSPDEPTIVFTEGENPLSCNSNDGDITIMATGGQGSYLFSVDGGQNFEVDNAIGQLSPGTYQVVVRNADGTCPVFGELITLIAPDEPLIDDIVVTNPSGCGTNDASITIQATGTETLEYTIDDGANWSTNNAFTNLTPGTYLPGVRNVGGTCETFDVPVTISGLEPNITDVFSQNPSDCGSADGLITVLVDNDGGDLQYSIDGGANFQIGNSFSGLTAGNYQVVVRKTDGSCNVTGMMVTLSDPAAPNYNGTTVNDATCGQNNGSLVISANGGSGSLEYSLNAIDWQFSATFELLAAGNYNVYVRNAGGTCEFGPFAVVVDNSAPVTVDNVVATDPMGCDVANGSIQVGAFGCPDADLQFSIDNGGSYQASNLFENLGAGTYTVVVRDMVTGTISTAQEVTLTGSSAPTIQDIAATPPTTCGASNGSITITTQGGTNLSYSIDGGASFSASNVFENLGDGSYSIVIGYGTENCTLEAGTPVSFQTCCDVQFTLSEFAPGVYRVSMIPNVSVTGASVEELVATITAPTMAVEVDNFVSLLSGADFEQTLRINGPVENTSTDYILFSAQNDLTLDLTAGQEIPLFQFSNGSGCGNDGNLALYNAGTDPFGFPNSTGDLVGQIVSYDGIEPETCTDNTQIFLDQTNLTISVALTQPSGCGTSDAQISVTASGGSGNYEYSIDGGTTYQGSGDFAGLNPNISYNVVVRDGSCELSYDQNPVVFTGGAAPTVDDIQIAPASCGLNDGQITVLASGGASLEYSLNGIDYSTSNTFASLAAGTYSIIVRNTLNGCTTTVGGNIVPGGGTTPSIDDVQVTPAGCNAADGQIVVVASGAAGLEYSLNGGAFSPNNTFANLAAGTYSVAVRDAASGCTSTQDNIVVTGGGAGTAPSIDDIQVTPAGCNAADGQIVVVASGAAGLEYSLNGGAFSPNNTFANLAAGTYSVVVRDVTSGCTTTQDNIVVTGGGAATAPSIDDIQVTPAGCGAADGQIVVVASGAAGLEYSLSGGAFSPNNTFANLTAGTYTVTVRDPATGCTTTSMNVVLTGQGTPPVIDNVVAQNPSDCNFGDGSITISATGTGAALQYSIDGGATFSGSNFFGNLTAGSYTVVVSYDDGSCAVESALNPVLLNDPTEKPTITGVLPVAPTTCDSNDGTITVTATGNGSPIEYSFDGGATYQTSNVGTGFAPGFVTVVIRYVGQTCQSLTPVTVPEPDGGCDGGGGGGNGDGCVAYFTGPDITLVAPLGNETVCVPLPLVLAQNYDLTLDGQPYAQAPLGCDETEQVYYSYALLPGLGEDGPYRLDGWDCNAAFFSAASIPDVNDLVDSMNVWDPQGNWINDEVQNVIIGGVPGVTYGNLVLTQIATDLSATITTNVAPAFLGLIVQVNGFGPHVLTATNPNDPDCTDSFTITLNEPQGGATTTETINITTGIDTPSELICVNGSELPGGTVVNFGFCDTPSNGGAITANDTCVQYFPNTGFLGTDTFCLLACDGGFPQTCDTTFVIVNVVPATDTIPIFVSATDVVDSCFTNFLTLPGNIVSSDLCGLNTAEVNATINGTCVTLDPVDSFAGTTSVCIVTCDDSTPTVCDTTVFVLTVASPCVNFIGQDTIMVTQPDSDLDTEVCIPFDGTLIADYSIFQNGAPYDGSVGTCNEATFLTYNYSSLPGDGISGPYTVDNWMVDGVTYSGTVNNLNDLLDSLNTWDNNGWILDGPNNNFQKFNPTATYSELTITQASSGTTVMLDPVYTDFTFGTLLVVPGTGIQEIVLQNVNTLCSDTIFVDIEAAPLCPPVFGSDSIDLPSMDGNADYCIPVDSMTLANDYTVTLDGVTLDIATLSACGTGTQLLLSGYGSYELILTETVDCADTLTINVIFINQDVIEVTTGFETPTDTLCINSLELPGPIDGFGYSIEPSNGMAPIVNDSCVVYLPNTGFFGLDTFCLVANDAAIPANTDTICYVITVNAPTDTIFLDATGILPFDTCLTADFIQLTEPIVSATACEGDDEITVTADNAGCVTLDLANDFTGGTATACAVFCDAQGVCDTTIFVVNLTDGCPEIFNPDTVIELVDDESLEYCLDIPLGEALTDYTILLDGGPLGLAVGCNNDSLVNYSYSLVPGMGNEGPYNYTWSFNGEEFTGTVDDFGMLADSINSIDGNSTWTLDTDNFNLTTTPDGDAYGDLTITQVSSNITTVLQPNTNLIPQGTQITFAGLGDHTLVVTDDETGCTDTLFVTLIDAASVVNITTLQNTTSDTVCVDTSGLDGNFATLTFCGDPSNGTLTIVNEVCLVYTPNLDYLGTDTACVTLCDDLNMCTEVNVYIEVVPDCQEVFTLSFDTIQSADCAVPVALCLPIDPMDIGDYTITDNGSVIDNFSGCDGDTSRLYSYFNTPGMLDTLNGPYLISWSVDGAVFSDTLSGFMELVDSMNVWDATGTWTEAFGIIGGGADGVSYGDIEVTQISTGANAVIELNVVVLPSDGSRFFLLPGNHQIIATTNVNGCADTLNVFVNCVDTVGCNDLFALSPNDLEISNCDSMARFCLNIPLDSLDNYTITDNGFPFLGGDAVCSDINETAALLLAEGSHQLIFTNEQEMCSDTFNVTVTCTGQFADITIDTTIYLGTPVTYCLDDLGVLVADVDTIINVCPGSSGDNLLATIDQVTLCVTLTPLELGMDTVCLQVCNTAGECIVVTLNVTVQPPCEDFIPIDSIAQGVVNCDGNADVCLPLTMPQLMDVVVEFNGIPSAMPFIPCDIDTSQTIKYGTLPDGGNAGPYRIDSWIIDGNVLSSDTFNTIQQLVDTINVWDPTGSWTLDAANQCINGGSPSTDYGFLFVTQLETGSTATLGVNQTIVPNGTLFTLPLGTNNLIFRDTITGCRDTIVTSLVCVTTDNVVDTVGVAMTDTLCVSTDELLGSDFTLSVGCNNDGGEVALIEVVNDTCVAYTGIEPGTETACLVLCDETGVCDTTFLTVFVPGADGSTVAVPDTVVTGQDMPTIINVWGNDTLVGMIDTFYILTPPTNGMANFLPDGTLNYVPDEGYCDDLVPDQLEYVICTSVNCDTATVTITVECTELEIFNAFSPNGDGVNESFVIRGLGQFPDHRLEIFNRWGNRVYTAENYLNDWEGTFDNKMLPSGTYFYLLMLDGEASKEENIRSGYLQIHR